MYACSPSSEAIGWAIMTFCLRDWRARIQTVLIYLKIYLYVEYDMKNLKYWRKIMICMLIYVDLLMERIMHIWIRCVNVWFLSHCNIFHRSIFTVSFWRWLSGWQSWWPVFIIRSQLPNPLSEWWKSRTLF